MNAIIKKSLETAWQPKATFPILRWRAHFLQAIREFFASREVLEVETPLLAHGTVPDPYIFSLMTRYNENTPQAETLYLQTSPEFAMKRLLAAGSGPIYQICKAFRDEEKGKLHNPEFTLLEWYRPGYSLDALMDEINEFLEEVCNFLPAKRLSYQKVFQEFLEINPHRATLKDLQNAGVRAGLEIQSSYSALDKDGWLFLLMSHLIEPNLGQLEPLFVYDFPASQAALARIRKEKGRESVAERFELYIGGMEIANGFHELTDENEQRQRFLKDLETRKQRNLSQVIIDEYLLAALVHGMPQCSGVALGIDRLFMQMTESESIDEVLCFTIDNA